MKRVLFVLITNWSLQMIGLNVRIGHVRVTRWHSRKRWPKSFHKCQLPEKNGSNSHFWSPCFLLINAKLVFIRQIEKGLLKCTLEWHLLLMIHISKMANAARPTKCLSRDYRWIHTALHSIFRARWPWPVFHEMFQLFKAKLYCPIGPNS